MAQIGLNCRASSGYVTDGTDETYCLKTDTYPQTRGGWTFGFEVGPTDSRNRTTTIDHRLAGMIYHATDMTLRIDLKGTGDHNVRCALNEYSNGNGMGLVIKDDTTAVETIGGQSPSANQYIDATGTIRTSDTDWVSNNAALSHTFTSTILRFNITDEGLGGNPTIAHAYVEEAATGGGGIPFILPALIQNGPFL